MNDFALWETEMLWYSGQRLNDYVVLLRARLNTGVRQEGAVLVDLREANAAYSAFPACAWWKK